MVPGYELAQPIACRPNESEGVGIDLAMVECIIRRHGGRIWAAAAVDGGATFCFTL
jgi:signal transduction histidine kinase